MYSVPLVALAQGGASHSPLEALEVLAVGLSVVFTALTLIWAMMVVMRRFEPAPPPPAPVPVAPPAPVAPAVPAGPDARTYAIIAAAVAAAVGAQYRIRRISLVGHEPSPTWAAYGRRSIHTSHRLRKG